MLGGGERKEAEGLHTALSSMSSLRRGTALQWRLLRVFPVQLQPLREALQVSELGRQVRLTAKSAERTTHGSKE